MSGAFVTARRSVTRSPADVYAKKSLLAKVTKSELKLLRVAVKRSDVAGGGPQLPLERSIDDFARICSYVHYRKDETKRLHPPIFGRGIKVNQDFTENRRVFTDEKNDKDGKPSRKSRSRSKYRSRSPRNRTRSPRNRSRSRSRRVTTPERSRRERSESLQRSRSRGRSKRKRSSSRKASSRRSLSKHRSPSRERRYSSERRRYKSESQRYSSRKSGKTRSPSRSPSPHVHERSCPLYERRDDKKSLTPLRPGEYRPGHPDLALRNKRQRSRSRSRSRSEDGRSRSRRSRSRADVPSTSRDKSSPGRLTGILKNVRRYPSPVRNDKREHRSRSRSPIKSDRYRRRSRTPHNSHSPTKRSYKGDRNRSPRRRSRSPQYGENIPRDYGYYEGWGPRLPIGRGGYPMQPFFAPGFHPRGMIPGPLIPPGHMIVPRMPIMPPYGPYRHHLPIYNSGAVRQRGGRPNAKSSTVTSEKDKDDDSEESRVVITEASSQDGEQNEDSGQQENTDSKKGNRARSADKATDKERLF